MTPGSLPLSTELYQEGTIIPPIKLARRGRLNQEIIQLICRNSRTPDERKGDLAAQTAAIKVGEQRMKEVTERYGLDETLEHMAALLDYTERVTRRAITKIPDGRYEVTDYMDDDGLSQELVPITVAITVSGDEMEIDFTGTSPQRPGCMPFHAIYNKAVEDMDFEAAFGLPQDQLIGDWMAAIRQQPTPSEEGKRIYSLLIQNIKNSQ